MLADRGRGRHMFPGFRGKGQNIAKDVWTIKEKLQLLDAIQILSGVGDNWIEVSKMMQGVEDTKETSGTSPEEAKFSPQNCHRQYQGIMDTVGKEIRKRGEVKDLAAAIRQYIVNERLKELSSMADVFRKQCISVYKSLKQSKGEDVDDLDDEIIQFEDVKAENTTTASSEGNSSYTNNKKGTEEEEDDITDLMGILPNVVDMDDEIDTSIMDTSEFEITSPSDSATAIKRALATSSSPKVSPQLKSLVRTAIAGTSEEGPRSALSLPGNSAPTLSMLLEMPPRDPGQPLPEISKVSKAAQHSPLETSPSRKLPLLLEPINRNRVSPLKSPDKSSAPENQSPKSSSPTLKRLLEGKILDSDLQGIKEEEIGQTKILQEVSSALKVMEVEVKKEQINAEAVADPKLALVTQGASVPTSSGFVSTKTPTAIDSNVQIEATRELAERINKLTTSGQLSDEIKQEVITPIEHISATPTKAVSLSSLDLKDKVGDLAVVTQNIGTVSPVKSSTRETSSLTIASSSISEISSVKTFTSVGDHVTKAVDKQRVTDEVSLLSQDDINVEIKTENDSESDSMNAGATSDISMIKENVRVGRTAKLEPPILHGKAEGTALQAKSPVKSTNVKETDQAPTEISKRDEAMPDIAGEMMDVDEGDEARKKVLIPAKTYSRKERYENMDTEDDSSSSTFETSVKGKSPSRVSSPGRSVKQPYDSTIKTETPSSERRGRKSVLSESRTTEKGIDTSQEEDTRVTRARAKPSPVPSPSRTPIGGGSSPVKGRPHTPESDSGSRTTRSRTTSVTSTSVTSAGATPATLESASKELDSMNKLPATPAGRKAQSTEENISSVAASDVETPTTSVTPVTTTGRGRGRGGRSSSQRVLDSLPSARQVIESNPSSPSSTTTSSTNMDDDKDHKNFRRNINIVLEQIKSHRFAGIFLKPITAPVYLEAVKRPMDLSTIKKNLDSGQIRNVAAFERDVLLMFVNAVMYNSESTETYKMTKAMEADVRSMIINYKMTHGLLSQRILDEQERLRDSDSTPVTPKPGRGRGRGRGRGVGGRGRGRKSQNNTSGHETESPIGDHSTAVESGGSESEMDVDVDKGRRRERESSPDIVDGHGDGGTKTRRSRLSGAKFSQVSNRTPSTSSDGSRRRHLSPDISSPNA